MKKKNRVGPKINEQEKSHPLVPQIKSGGFFRTIGSQKKNCEIICQAYSYLM